MIICVPNLFLFLASYPTCNTTNGADYVSVTCTINYYGHWSPTMEWGRCDEKDEYVITDYFENSDANERVTSTFVIRQNGIQMQACLLQSNSYMYVQGRWPTHGTDADNIPAYIYEHKIAFKNFSEMCRKYSYCSLFNQIYITSSLIIIQYDDGAKIIIGLD